MKKTILLVVCAGLISAGPVWAQDPCTTQIGPFIVTSGAPYTVTWLADALVPTSPSDSTLIPNRVNGYTIQIDAGPKVDVGLPTAGPTCPSGTPNAGKNPYSYRSANGVTRGSHTLSHRAWNYVLDAAGLPTTVVQESAAVVVPFTAADPTLLGAPPSALNIGIRK